MRGSGNNVGVEKLRIGTRVCVVPAKIEVQTLLIMLLRWIMTSYLVLPALAPTSRGCVARAGRPLPPPPVLGYSHSRGVVLLWRVCGVVRCVSAWNVGQAGGAGAALVHKNL